MSKAILTEAPTSGGTLLAQLRLRWESCKKPKAHHSDTTEGSKEQSQWLGLASQAKCGKSKATSAGNRE